MLAEGRAVGALGLQVAFGLHLLSVNRGAHYLHTFTGLLVGRMATEGLYGQ